VWSSSFSPDGLRIATASRDRTVRIWDAATYKTTAVLRGLGEDSPTAAFSPDGSRVVTTSTGRIGRIWDVPGGKEVAQLGVGNFETFSPDWKRLVEVEFAQARVRDAATLREIAVLAGHSHAIWSADFSPDGTRIVTASEDRTARVWDAATGRELGVLSGHRGIVRFAAFSRDGTRVVTASDDKTARVWDAATAKEIGILRGHRGSVRSAAFDPTRPRVVTASEDGTARIWNVDLQFRPLQDIIAQACARLSRLSQMTRDEMRLAGYPDSEPLVDLCP
jgi:WD40 repeat protein